MFKVGLLAAGSALAQEPFTDSAKFERWSHFKDYGVPAVMGKDALNSAAIADGTCRLLNEPFDGFAFWHYPSRVERVLKALADAPPTSNPSNFVLSAEKALLDACQDKRDVASRPSFGLQSLAGSVQNWYHALTAPASDPSWKGKFDPVYQPQQVAITAGLMCITACDLNGGTLSESAMHELALLPPAVNVTYPWATGNTVFSGASSVQQLAESLKAINGANQCGCVLPVQGEKADPKKLTGSFCPDSHQAIYADMHDGDKKEVTISGGSITIRPSGNNQTWLVKSKVDKESCSASINFSVPGKPGPPPVNLQATLWISLGTGIKTLFEFTDPSGTLATKEYPLNLWVEEQQHDALSFQAKENRKQWLQYGPPGSKQCFPEAGFDAVYADMHDGDKKQVVGSGSRPDPQTLVITPFGNNQTWVVKSEWTPNTCSASINFNVPGKPGPPPVNLQATLIEMLSAKIGPDGVHVLKTGLEFTDPSGTLAPSTEPLNHWVEISHKESGAASSMPLIV